jgi:toluene monooxygenase system protein E
MARLEHPGKKSYWHLTPAAKRPSEYAVRSGRLDYYRPARFEVDAPLVAWFERYAAERTLQDCDWEAFDDPSALTYASYVARRRDDELFAQRLLDADTESPKAVTPALRELWARGLSTLRFPYHGLQMTCAYVAHLAPASKITICALFQAADELRRVQRCAYRLAELQAREQAPLASDGKANWLNDEAWQGLRRLIETLLVSYDFSEAFFALTGIVAPACDSVLLGSLSERLAVLGDETSARLLRSLLEDARWHREWSSALGRLIVRSNPANGARFRELERAWKPLVAQALEPVARDVLGVPMASLDALSANVRSSWEF